MKFIASIFIALAPIAVVHTAEQSLTELSCSDFRPTEQALERYRDLKGACEGIVERNGELYAKFAATVRRVSQRGGSIQFYPAKDAPLDLVKVGDRVRFQVTRATAISIERPD